MDFIEEMKKLIYERSHYQRAQSCNAPATLKEVRDFERDMNIVLPENYVRYLTELGNGGPGGLYRIYSLDHVRNNYSPEWAAETAQLPPMLDHSLSDDEWKDFGKRYAEADENDEDTGDMEKHILAGGIVIGTAGCTMMLLLMCRGAAAGEVFLIDFDYMESLSTT